MASSINASTSGAGGLISTADNTGILNLQTGGTTAVTIDASQRAAFVAGTAALPAITTSGDTNTGMFFPAADTIAFAEGGTEAVRIDSSGQLLMNILYGGFDSDSTGAITLNANASDGVVNFKKGIVFSSDGGSPQNVWAHGGITSTGSPGFNGNLIFGTDGSGTQSATITERMRINSNGNMLIGTTTEAANETRIVLSTNSGTTRWSVGPWSSVANNFYISATSGAQGVYLSGTTATSWSGLSDERAKDIIEPIENAIEKVSTLRAVIGKYKLDNEDNRKAFLIAQDVQAVLPEAVSIANPENGHLGLAYTDVIPLLVAAIKEQTQIINDLKARIETLEAK